MKVIKIIRESIKKNPRAGQETTVIQGAKDMTFEFEGNFPVELRNNDDIIITSETLDKKLTTGIILHPKAVELLHKFGAKISVKHNHDFINHRPLPKYLYEYENTSIVCNNCENEVFINDITVEYDDDGCISKVCPKCCQFDTFEDYTYEDIRDIKIDI